jgi:hypothetical protein
MGRSGYGAARQHGLKLVSRFQSLQFEAAPELQVSCALCVQAELDCQTLAAFGATSVDHSTAAAGFHANQKTVRAGAFDLGGLVSAFHFGNPKGLSDGPPLLKISKNEWAAVLSPPTQSGEPAIIANFLHPGNTLHYIQPVIPAALASFPACG